jgi:tetratricopeptide (TPR) repeat protein
MARAKVLLAIFALVSSSWGSFRASGVFWVKSLDVGFALAKRRHKPMLVVFNAPQRPSDSLMAESFNDPDLQEALNSFVPVDLAGSSTPELLTRYRVHAVPAVVFISSEGILLTRVTSGFDAPDFLLEVRKALKAEKDWPAVRAKLAKSPKDGPSNARLASLEANSGDLKAALAALKNAEEARYTGPDLAVADNAIGDEFQTSLALNQALPYFLAGKKAARTSFDLAYSLVSLQSVYMSLRKPAQAKEYAHMVLQVKNAPVAYASFARQFLLQNSGKG